MDIFVFYHMSGLKSRPTLATVPGPFYDSVRAWQFVVKSTSRVPGTPVSSELPPLIDFRPTARFGMLSAIGLLPSMCSNCS
jgi:hypothetical protein